MTSSSVGGSPLARGTMMSAPSPMWRRTSSGRPGPSTVLGGEPSVTPPGLVGPADSRPRGRQRILPDRRAGRDAPVLLTGGHRQRRDRRQGRQGGQRGQQRRDRLGVGGRLRQRAGQRRGDRL